MTFPSYVQAAGGGLDLPGYAGRPARSQEAPDADEFFRPVRSAASTVCPDMARHLIRASREHGRQIEMRCHRHQRRPLVRTGALSPALSWCLAFDVVLKDRALARDERPAIAGPRLLRHVAKE
jgi:hypothetical protein